MSIVAYDSARPFLIPENPPAIFPYSDGHYAWSHERFPEAEWRYITCTGRWESDIADCEEGCIWPPENLHAWAKARRDRGLDVTVYCDRSNFQAVREVLHDIPWHLFLATLDGSKPTEWEGMHVRAVQYTDHANAWDESLVYDDNWLNKPTPKTDPDVVTAPAMTAEQFTNVTIPGTATTTGTWIWAPPQT